VLKSGDHLREEPLAQMTGTSRTPVRDALGRLVAEGLAVQMNRHRFVADFSFEEITVVFGLRARIEGYAASLAAQRITLHELETLTDIIHQIDQLAGLDPEVAAEGFLKLNAEFHSVIVRATRSSQLQALIAQTVAVPLTTIKKFVWDQKLNIVRSNAQHRDILEALSQRDSDWAEASMTGHILSTRPKSPPVKQQGSGSPHSSRI
jgi:DNA-binding GntR family transcriptional regulator